MSEVFVFRSEVLRWRCPRCLALYPPIHQGVHEIQGCRPPVGAEKVGRENPGFMIDTGLGR